MASPGFLNEDSGSPSMIRVMSLLALLNAIGLSWYSIICGKTDITLISAFLGVAFTGKVVQKVFESKKVQ